MDAARAEGVELVGPGGLLSGLTKTVLETAFEAEMSEHLAVLRARRVVLPLHTVRVGDGTACLVVENGETFDSLCRALTKPPGWRRAGRVGSG